jgi:2-methylisocitrate lyase-like PEP mutase family enzyme
VSFQLIIARTDARAVLGLAAAIDRANAYAAAGADVIFVEAPQSDDEVRQIAAGVTAPLLFNQVPEGVTPEQGQPRLRELGFAVAIYPTVLFGPVAAAMTGALQRLGGVPPVVTSTGIASFFDLVGLKDWFTLGEKWAPRA